MCIPNILINDLKQQQQWKQVRLTVVVKIQNNESNFKCHKYVTDKIST